MTAACSFLACMMFSMDDVKEHFGRFQRTDRRPKLFAKLVEYLDALTRPGMDGSVIEFRWPQDARKGIIRMPL